MSNSFSLVLLSGLCVCAATGLFLMIKGIINVIFNSVYRQAYGPGDVVNGEFGVGDCNWNYSSGPSFGGEDCGGDGGG